MCTNREKGIILLILGPILASILPEILGNVFQLRGLETWLISIRLPFIIITTLLGLFYLYFCSAWLDDFKEKNRSDIKKQKRSMEKNRQRERKFNSKMREVEGRVHRLLDDVGCAYWGGFFRCFGRKYSYRHSDTWWEVSGSRKNFKRDGEAHDFFRVELMQDEDERFFFEVSSHTDRVRTADTSSFELKWALHKAVFDFKERIRIEKKEAREEAFKWES
ncbi:hypothetical protein JW964_05885 [candidate division KSB1 bacterium]|nr:hypothetical protein [candidate division KSB1 bacterium]